MLMLLVACQVMSQTTISGIVTDGREPLAGANVFIIGTIDGCLTDSLGRFSFQTSKTGEMTLRATFIGFDDATLCPNLDGSGVGPLSAQQSQCAEDNGFSRTCLARDD